MKKLVSILLVKPQKQSIDTVDPGEGQRKRTRKVTYTSLWKDKEMYTGSKKKGLLTYKIII